jgi:uncharacterized protein with PIN domain
VDRFLSGGIMPEQEPHPTLRCPDCNAELCRLAQEQDETTLIDYQCVQCGEVYVITETILDDD